MRFVSHTTCSLMVFMFALACSPPAEETDDMSMMKPSDSAPDCQSRCVTKATSCGFPPAMSQQICAQTYCNGTPTESYVSCMEKVSCAQVQDPEDLKALCGGGDPKPTDDCDGYPRCDGNSRVTCSMVNGAQVLETKGCASDKMCEAGVCEQIACTPTGKTGCQPHNNPSLCCDDRLKCTANGNKKGETICCNLQGQECSEDEDCCGSDSGVACVANACKLML